MENEQCGICWNLKYNKQGEKTHSDRNENFHNFVSMDYCVKCKKPEYNQFGIQTHPEEKNDFSKNKSLEKSHKFISGIQTEYQENKRRKRNVFLFFLVSAGTGISGSLLSLFF